MRLGHWNVLLSMWGEVNETESIELFIFDFKGNVVVFHLTENEKWIWFPKCLKAKGRSVYTMCENDKDEWSFDEVIHGFTNQCLKYSNCMSIG